MVASGAAAWANLRVEGIAIDQYAKKTLKFHPNAATLAKAQESLEGELGDASESATTPCTGTPAQALAAMPTEMRNFESPSPGGVARVGRQARHDDPADDGVGEDVLRRSHRGLRHDLCERGGRRSVATHAVRPGPGRGHERRGTGEEVLRGLLGPGRRRLRLLRSRQ